MQILDQCPCSLTDPVRAINLIPGMHAEILTTAAQGCEVLLLIGNALGGVAGTLIPTLKRIIEAGTPVIILTDNAGAGHGVLRIVDQNQEDALAVGCIYLEKANVTHVQEVIAAIQTAAALGSTGQQLAECIRMMYVYGPDEPKPVSRLGTAKGLQQFVQEMRMNTNYFLELDSLSRHSSHDDDGEVGAQ